MILSHRHCERSEAIHRPAKKVWIASSLSLLAMTPGVYAYGGGTFVIGFFCASAATVEVPIGPFSS